MIEIKEVKSLINRLGKVKTKNIGIATACGYQIYIDRNYNKIYSLCCRDERGCLFWIGLDDADIVKDGENECI